jgi:hypothetical protein
MADHDQHEGEPTLVPVTTAANQLESAMICDLLADAGIRATAEGGMWARGTIGGKGNIYVDERDLVRASEVLQAAEDLSEEELAREEQSSERGDPHAPSG